MERQQPIEQLEQKIKEITTKIQEISTKKDVKIAREQVKKIQEIIKELDEQIERQPEEIEDLPEMLLLKIIPHIKETNKLIQKMLSLAEKDQIDEKEIEEIEQQINQRIEMIEALSKVGEMEFETLPDVDNIILPEEAEETEEDETSQPTNQQTIEEPAEFTSTGDPELDEILQNVFESFDNQDTDRMLIELRKFDAYMDKQMKYIQEITKPYLQKNEEQQNNEQSNQQQDKQ